MIVAENLSVGVGSSGRVALGPFLPGSVFEAVVLYAQPPQIGTAATLAVGVFGARRTAVASDVSFDGAGLHFTPPVASGVAGGSLPGADIGLVETRAIEYPIYHRIDSERPFVGVRLECPGPGGFVGSIWVRVSFIRERAPAAATLRRRLGRKGGGAENVEPGDFRGGLAGFGFSDG